MKIFKDHEELTKEEMKAMAKSAIGEEVSEVLKRLGELVGSVHGWTRVPEAYEEVFASLRKTRKELTAAFMKMQKAERMS